MIKLFYSPGSCSMSCHIALEEAGLPYEAIRVDWENPNASLAEMERLNPLGVVPVLVSEQGKTLTQNAAILEYIADAKPSSHLLAPVGSWERSETMAWLSFVAADLHKAFAPLYALKRMSNSESGRAEIKSWAVNQIHSLLSHVDNQLQGKDFLTGKNFTIADAYLFVVVSWSKDLKIQTTAYSNLSATLDRIYRRPAVQNVFKAEGIQS